MYVITYSYLYIVIRVLHDVAFFCAKSAVKPEPTNQPESLECNTLNYRLEMQLCAEDYTVV